MNGFLQKVDSNGEKSLEYLLASINCLMIDNSINAKMVLYSIICFGKFIQSLQNNSILIYMFEIRDNLFSIYFLLIKPTSLLGNTLGRFLSLFLLSIYCFIKILLILYWVNNFLSINLFIFQNACFKNIRKTLWHALILFNLISDFHFQPENFFD